MDDLCRNVVYFGFDSAKQISGSSLYFFAGLYPMVKSAAEKLPRIASAAVKLVFFNAVFTLIMLMGRYLLHLPKDEIGLDTAIYVLGNLMLVAYDYLLTQLITLYQRKLRKMLRLGGMFG